MVIVQSCPCLVHTFRHTIDFVRLLVDGNRSNSYAGLMATTTYSTYISGFTYAWLTMCAADCTCKVDFIEQSHTYIAQIVLQSNNIRTVWQYVCYIHARLMDITCVHEYFTTVGHTYSSNEALVLLTVYVCLQEYTWACPPIVAPGCSVCCITCMDYIFPSP
jgi:hypothetical protein